MIDDTYKFRPLKRLFNRARNKLQRCCPHCTYDEAEGMLLDHCPECCHKIVQELWQAFYLSSDAQNAAAKKRLHP